jgi:molybdate transport system substrate-binding protein
MLIRCARTLTALLLLAICMSVQAAQLVVVVPSGLSGAMIAVAQRFEREVTQSKVRIVSAGAETILQHAAIGAMIDVLVTADLQTMDQAAAQKLLYNDTRRMLLRDRLVLIASAKSTMRLASLADLLRGDLRRISVGLPASVVSGNFARHVLEVGGLWQALFGKFVFARAATEAVEAVVREEVDVAFALLSDANSASAPVRTLLEIDSRIPNLYLIAVAKSSSDEKLARRFVDFVGSAQAWQSLEQWGFARP